MNEERAGKIQAQAYTSDENGNLVAYNPYPNKAYEKALQDILNASTVGEMVRIADRVLKENKQ